MSARAFEAGLAALTLAHLAGCAQILGFEDHAVKDTAGSAGAAAGGGTGGANAMGGSGALPGKGGNGMGGSSGGNTGGANTNGGTGGNSSMTGGDAGDTGSGATGGSVGQGGSGTGGDGSGGATGGTGGGSNGGTGGGSSGDAGAGDNGGTGGGGTGGSAGMSGSAGAGGTVALPPPIGENQGTQGFATWYWDCCKPSSGYSGNLPPGVSPMPTCDHEDAPNGNPDLPSACTGGPAYMCWSATPWALSADLAYGFASGNASMDEGECYQVEFYTSSHMVLANDGNLDLGGQTMIVQIVNRGGVASTEVDLLIPGGGIGDFTNACPAQWGVASTDLGSKFGGILSDCSQNADYSAITDCVATKCSMVFGEKQELLDGCNWFNTWFHAAAVPELQYQHIQCPTLLTDRSGLADTWGGP